MTTGEVTDRQRALRTLKRCKPSSGPVQSLLCDSGYTGEPFAQEVKEVLGEHIGVQIAKPSELHTFNVILKHWIVERCFAWLDKNRRPWKNCERRLKASKQAQRQGPGPNPILNACPMHHYRHQQPMLSTAI